MTRHRFSLLALVLSACSPNSFDGTLDRAPVQLIERPGGFGSNGGRVLLPLAPPADSPKVAARLLFAGTEKPSLGVADFDGDGKPSVTVVNEDDLVGLGLGWGITSMAWLAGSGTLVLGVAEHNVIPNEVVPLGKVAFARMGANPDGKLSFTLASRSMDGNGLVGGRLGLAVARGQVTQLASEEVVAVADNGVRVFTPGGAELASAICTGGIVTPPDLYRSLAVADFLGGGQQEIAMGLPLLGGVGRVVILQHALNPAGTSSLPELFCAQELRAPDAGVQAVSGFGTSLAAVPDQDGDARSELLVGAPPDRAYLFFSGGAAPLVFNKGDTLSEFGQRVATVDIDRDGAPEVAISALQANAGKTMRAGAVFFYKLNGTRVAELFDSNPVANKEFFGIGLADMEFHPNRDCGKGVPVHVPVVGADKGIFAFFRFAGGGADPRCFAQ